MFRKTMFDDEKLNEVFKNANFGVAKTAANHRLILKNALLKTAAGYHNGHTITQIMIKLGLISSKNLRVLKVGQHYLREVQHDYEVLMKTMLQREEPAENAAKEAEVACG